MHPKHRVRKRANWFALVGVLTWAAAGLAVARADEVPLPARGQLIVLINGTHTLQMSTKKNLKTVTNQDPNIARVSPVPEDPTKVQITGLRAGLTRIILTDVNNQQEAYDVVVQTNVEHLRAILRQVAPTANVQLIPASENTMVLNGTVERAEDIDAIVRTAQSAGGYQIINHMRTDSVSQVQLCVVVARVSRNLGRNFGYNFLFNSGKWLGGSTIGNVIPPLAPIGDPSTQLTPPSTIGQVLNSIPGAGNLFGGAINNHAGFLGFLEALEAEGLAKVLAEPRLVTLSGRPASFLDGGEQAIPVPAGLGQVGVQFEEFGVRLNFLPIVLGNGKIHLEIEPEVSAISNNPSFGTAIGGVAVAGRVTQRVHTTVELEDGQTFAVGGLIQKSVTANAAKVPVLGQLPFVGAFFSTKNYSEEDAELVVLVTPHLVDAMDCRQVPRVLPGEETRSPDDYELFLEGILEAPRGSREVFPGGHYMPAYKNGPTAGQFPCAPPKGRAGCNGGTVGCAGPGGPTAGDVIPPEGVPQTVTDPKTVTPNESLPPPNKQVQAAPDPAVTTGSITPVSGPSQGTEAAAPK
jgi:pilus assembly protein CpaC